jgi:signal transduction histidine kinase
VGYLALKVPLSIFGVFVVGTLWIKGLSDIIDGVLNQTDDHVIATIIFGFVLVLLAPWATRVLVYVDRMLMQLLLGPDPVAARMRSLEVARARTVDSSAATLRRIERDLHDGTQAQLIALAMRLGMAKEQLHAKKKDMDLAKVRQLVDLAHLETKEIIVELRDLTRGIHPPALDVGLEGALTTLAARSSIPTEVEVSVPQRPTASIEAIAYFCVAELLANVAKHAQASRAWVSCTEVDDRLHIEVRDDGLGGARFSAVGSSSSGLGGLAERALAVDGRLEISSPDGGPTLVIVELPMHA